MQRFFASSMGYANFAVYGMNRNVRKELQVKARMPPSCGSDCLCLPLLWLCIVVVIACACRLPDGARTHRRSHALQCTAIRERAHARPEYPQHLYEYSARPEYPQHLYEYSAFAPGGVGVRLPLETCRSESRRARSGQAARQLGHVARLEPLRAKGTELEPRGGRGDTCSAASASGLRMLKPKLGNSAPAGTACLHA